IDITLSDGTRVWLNAASSIRYPTAFQGTDRTVEITGEAYFEVAHNSAQPFHVKKTGGDWTVQVLGTHFNVNAYDDEPAAAITLLEGSVTVETKKERVLLKPGEQAALNPVTLSLSKGGHIDLDQVMAWKNGLFSFTNADVPTVVRQLARWYNV